MVTVQSTVRIVVIWKLGHTQASLDIFAQQRCLVRFSWAFAVVTGSVELRGIDVLLGSQG